jgi:transcriptional regulator with XRE-family HTH domain
MGFQCRRPNPVFSDEYRVLLDVVRQARRRSGLSQRELATRLGKAQSHVCMIERGQRRIDSLELYFMAKAVGVDPGALFGQIARRLDDVAEAAG